MENPSLKRKAKKDYVGNALSSRQRGGYVKFIATGGGGSTSGASGSNGPPARPSATSRRRRTREDVLTLQTLENAQQDAGIGASKKRVYDAVNAAMPVILEREARKRGRNDGQDDNGVDNGSIPFDTMGNMPLTKFNKLFGLTSWDRQIVGIKITLVANTQSNTTLFTASTYPCTATGFRWNLNVNTDTTVSKTDTTLVLQRVRQGITIGVLAQTNNTPIINNSAEEVIVWDFSNFTFTTSGIWQTPSLQSTNKAYRFDVGDTMVLSLLSEGALDVTGAIEFWICV